VYDEYGKHILKESHWFHMSSRENKNLFHRKKKQITAIEWTNASRRKTTLTAKLSPGERPA
jgi:hypothetical protein